MNPKQLEQLILANHRSLELFAAQWTSAPEDCVQEAFLKLHRIANTDSKTDPNIESNAGSPKILNPKAWLYRAVRNLAIDAGRSESSRKSREQKFSLARPLFTQSENNQLDSNEVQQALEQLPGDQREIIVARIWGRLNLEEIGEAFGIATSTAHRRYELGIKQLQQYFEVPCQIKKDQ